MYHVLVIDDEDGVRSGVARRLERQGYLVEVASGAEEGVSLIGSSPEAFDVVVTDMSMEDPESGLKVLNAAFARDLFTEVIVMTAYGNVGNAVECMRRGAFDYIEKNTPGVDAYEMLALKIDQAMERRHQHVRTLDRWERVLDRWERVARAAEKRQ